MSPLSGGFCIESVFSLQKPSRFTWVALVLSKILTCLHQWLSFIPPLTPPHRKLQPWCTQSLPRWGISFRQALDKVPSTGVQDVHCPRASFLSSAVCLTPPTGLYMVVLTPQQRKRLSFLKSNRQCGPDPQPKSLFSLLPAVSSLACGRERAVGISWAKVLPKSVWPCPCLFSASPAPPRSAQFLYQ